MSDLRKWLLMRLVNIYPPYLGAGVSARNVPGDAYAIRATMPLRFYNRNLFGTQFGGSLYAMCDPWFVFLLVRHLGGGYVVWDKAASIEFLKPGRGRVSAVFRVTPEEVDDVRARADAGERVEPVLRAEVVSDDGTLVARVEKRLHVRKLTSAPPD